MLVQDKPPDTRHTSISLTDATEITSTQNQFAALHSWSQVAPSGSSKCDEGTHQRVGRRARLQVAIKLEGNTS